MTNKVMNIPQCNGTYRKILVGTSIEAENLILII